MSKWSADGNHRTPQWSRSFAAPKGIQWALKKI